MLYKIIKSDLFINGKLIPEGSTIELSENEKEHIANYLIPIVDDSNPKPVNNSPIEQLNNKINPEHVEGTDNKIKRGRKAKTSGV